MTSLNTRSFPAAELEQPSDDELLGQMHRGCEHSFNALFNKYWKKAYADAFKRVQDSDVAKDIVQEVFVHLWEKREVLHILNLPAYLNVAIRNKVFKQLEKRANHIPFFDVLDNMPSSHSKPDGNLLGKELLNFYESLVTNLPDKGQNIFRLHYEEDLPTNEIAAKLGISRKTVQNQLRRAVKKLKVSLTPFLSLLVFFLSGV